MRSKKYEKYLKENTLVLFQGKEEVSKGILEAQSIYTKEKYGKKSLWSHIGFIGSDKKFYESTVKLNFIFEKKVLFKVFGKEVFVKIPKIKYVYGIYITDLEKRFKNIEKYDSMLGFIYDIKELTQEDWKRITKIGQEMKKNKIKYGGLELFGTLFAILKYKTIKDKKKKEKIFKKKNIFNTSSVYCVAFVADCIKKGSGKNITDENIDHSVMVVDEVWLNPKLSLKKQKFSL